MRGIVYNGVDLSDACCAEVIERVALPVVADVMAVPGRAGALLVSGRVPPRIVRVRLYLDAGLKLDAGTAVSMQHRLYANLCATDGGTLVLPDEPEVEYHDAVCTDAGTWTSLFEDGHGDVTFTLYVGLPAQRRMTRSRWAAPGPRGRPSRSSPQQAAP